MQGTWRSIARRTQLPDRGVTETRPHTLIGARSHILYRPPNYILTILLEYLFDMNYSDPKLVHFSLRGRDINELRSLAERFLQRTGPEISQMTKGDLINELSEAARRDKGLSGELRKGAISLKPSFYLMRFSDDAKIPVSLAARQLNQYLQDRASGLKNLEVQLVNEVESGLVQVVFTWQSPFRYWAPTFTMMQVEQLEMGFAVLSYQDRKAVVVCHTLREREEITKLLAKGFSIQLSSIVLTKPLLNQIGTFDRVKRAQYAISQTDAATPANITYADENLASRSLARDEEDNPRSQRSQSFYRIPITNSLLEEGVGATSESGKLWIPKEIPFDSIRGYSTALLSKISGTLDRMAKKDEIEEVLSTFNFDEMPELNSADPLSFRESLADLARTLVIMLSRKETDRPYIVPFEIARHGAPRFFNHPRLRIVDPETREVGFWSDKQYMSPQVSLLGTAGEVELRSHPGGELIDTTALRHPVTDAVVSIDNVLEELEFVPTEQFLKVVHSSLARVSEQLPKLKTVTNVVFRISGNVIRLDVARAYGRPEPNQIRISANEIVELQSVLAKHSITPQKRPTIRAKLVELGEKCAQMSDENCRNCVQDRDKLCLRSLLGHYLKNAEILAHKGIELCDMSCRGTIGTSVRRMWGFAKLPSSNTDHGITLRNKPGAVLLAQIFGQIDKTSYRTILVISPSAINQDFQERAELLCSAFGKELCIVDADDLGRLLVDFEEQAAYDGLNLSDIYKNSRTKIGKSARRKKKASEGESVLNIRARRRRRDRRRD